MMTNNVLSLSIVTRGTHIDADFQSVTKLVILIHLI
jgi:hypothetical protein